MKILITGVAGFFGSNLAQELINRGEEVVGIDDFSHGLRINMEQFVNHPKFHFYEEDICNLNVVLQAAQGCNAIIHLAAYKIPRYYDALHTMIINAHE